MSHSPPRCAAPLIASLESISGRAEHPLEARSLNRASAIRDAWSLGAEGVRPLLEVVADTDGGAARAAREALEQIVTHAARPGAEHEAGAVSTALWEIARSTMRIPARRYAVHLLGVVGGASRCRQLGALLEVEELREDVRLALIRMPDSSADEVLREARSRAKGSFRTSLDQALLQRSRGRAVR